MENSLKESFSEYGGILYGMIGANNLSEKSTINSRYKSSLLLWILVSEAIARADQPDDILAWVQDTIAEFGACHPKTSDFINKEMARNWSAWLPLVLMAKSDEKQSVWLLFNQKYLVYDPQELALKQLIFSLVQRYGKGLFEHGHWIEEVKEPDRYTTPDSCAIVKIGLTLAKLQNEADPEIQPIFDNWRKVLLSEVLKKLPNRIRPGFVKESPGFEKFVLSIMAVADWLVQPGHQKVTEMVRTSFSRVDEQLDPNQLCFAGALYGWIKGYKTAAGSILDLPQRRYISGLALRLSYRQNTDQWNVKGIDPLIFYATPNGGRYSFTRPFIQISQISSTKKFNLSQNNSLISSHDTVQVEYGHQAYKMTITLEGI